MLHLRCETPSDSIFDLFDPVADNPRIWPRVWMVSLMDHTPGYGQYNDIPRYRIIRRKEGVDDETIDRRIAEMRDQRERRRTPNRAALFARLAALAARGRRVAVASHDDRTVEEVARMSRTGLRHQRVSGDHGSGTGGAASGMQVVAGAPNVVRGGSHSGNVAATDLPAGEMDAFASDYVPASPVEAAFFLAIEEGLLGLPPAIATVSAQPARLVGLTDRGRIVPEQRADLARVRMTRDCRSCARCGAAANASHDGQPRTMTGRPRRNLLCAAADDPLAVAPRAGLGAIRRERRTGGTAGGAGHRRR